MGIVHWSSRTLFTLFGIVEYLLRGHDIQEKAVFAHLGALRWHGLDIRHLIASRDIERISPIDKPVRCKGKPVWQGLDTSYRIGPVVEHWLVALLGGCWGGKA